MLSWCWRWSEDLPLSFIEYRMIDNQTIMTSDCEKNRIDWVGKDWRAAYSYVPRACQTPILIHICSPMATPNPQEARMRFLYERRDTGKYNILCDSVDTLLYGRRGIGWCIDLVHDGCHVTLISKEKSQKKKSMISLNNVCMNESDDDDLCLIFTRMKKTFFHFKIVCNEESNRVMGWVYINRHQSRITSNHPT